MSRTTQITYRRTMNLGNYESVSIEQVVVLDHGDDLEQEYIVLEQTVLNRLDAAADAKIMTEA